MRPYYFFFAGYLYPVSIDPRTYNRGTYIRRTCTREITISGAYNRWAYDLVTCIREDYTRGLITGLISGGLYLGAYNQGLVSRRAYIWGFISGKLTSGAYIQGADIREAYIQ